MRRRIWIAFFGLGLLSMACGLQAEMSPTLPVDMATASPTQAPTLEPDPVLQETPTSQTSPLFWKEYRDARFGYGLALPCFWSYYPTPPEGNFAAMTARNFSEEFYQAHSVRGEWVDGNWPEGTMALNVIAIEGIDPSLTMEEAIAYIYENYSSEQAVNSIEPVRYGDHNGVLVTVTDGLAGGGTHRLVYFPLSPDTLLSVVFMPDSALEHPDAQAILASLATAVDEPVELPTSAATMPDPSVSCQ